MSFTTCVFELTTQASELECDQEPHVVRCGATSVTAMIQPDRLIWLCAQHVRPWLAANDLTLEQVLR